jgi:uncharacterized protein
MTFTLVHAAIALTTGFAAFVSVAFAIGNALISVPVISLFAGTKMAVAVGLFFNVFTGAQFWFYRHKVSWPDAMAILPVSLLATLAGLFLFFRVNDAALSAALAAYLVVFVVRQWLRPAEPEPEAPAKPSLLAPVAAATLSGLFQGMLGIGGPPLAIYLKKRKLPKDVFRATLMLCFFASNLLRVGMSIPIFEGEIFWGYVLPSVPLFIAGSIAGHYIPRLLSERVFQYCIDAILLLSALLLIGKSGPQLLGGLF